MITVTFHVSGAGTGDASYMGDPIRDTTKTWQAPDDAGSINFLAEPDSGNPADVLGWAFSKDGLGNPIYDSGGYTQKSVGVGPGATIEYWLLFAGAAPPVQYDVIVGVYPVGPVVAGYTNPAVGTYPIDEGATFSVTAFPNSGYRFVGWTGDINNANASISFTVTAATNLIANFELIPTTTYTLTTSVLPAGTGNIIKNPEGTVFYEGDIVTLTAIPATGWQFDGWSGDASGTTSPINVTMNANKNITANFSQIVNPPGTFSLTISVIGQGTTNPSGTNSYDENIVVAVTAIPASGWLFYTWSGNASGSNPNINVTMNANKAIVATFYEEGTSPPFNMMPWLIGGAVVIGALFLAQKK